MLLDEVIEIEPAARRVITRDNADQSYDYLIVATGSADAYFGHEDWPRHAPGLQSLEDAVAIRRRLLLAFERAETTRDPTRRERLLTVVLVGGGPTGVEMAGAIAELAKARSRATFATSTPRPPASCWSRRVHACCRASRRSSAPTRRRRCGGWASTSGSTPWSRRSTPRGSPPGASASRRRWSSGPPGCAPLRSASGSESPRRATVRSRSSRISVASFPEVFVLGDAARVPGPDGKPLPGLAAVAEQQGRYVAELIAARVERRVEPGPFVYRDRGTMATIGRSAAVADFGGIQLTGYTAWLLWGLVHTYLLIGFRNRVAVFVNWVWSWLTYGRGARLITGAGLDS